MDGAYYDTSPLVARVELGEMYFDQVGSEEEGVFFNVRDLGMSNPGYPKELVFKGKNRYLKVRGGLVALCDKTLESHSAMLNYNDSLDYYMRYLPTGEYNFVATLSYWNVVSVTKRCNVT